VKQLQRLILCGIFFGAVFTVTISCEEKRPEGILTEQEMVSVMEELYIAEEKINHLALASDSSKKVFGSIQSKIFEAAAVNDSVFKRSFDYYMEHPRQLETIYTALVDTLQLREQRAPFSLE
jgi:hypothetical protein